MDVNKFVLLSYVRIVWDFYFNSNWDSIRDERLYIQYETILYKW